MPDTQISDEMVQDAVEAYAANDPDETLLDGAAMRAALTAALAEMWRPIEEAPKDRPVLVTAYIVPSDEARRNGSEPFWDVATGRAYGTKLERWSGILGTRPSHWMPLPAPPKTGGE